MNIKELLQKYMPYSIYFMFAWLIIGGFPTIYIYRTGEYISSHLVVSLYFVFCTVMLTYFAKNTVAKDFKWFSSVVSLFLIESYFYLLFLQYYFVLSICILIVVIVMVVLIYMQMCKCRPVSKHTSGFLKYCKKRTTIVCVYLTVPILLIPATIGFYKEYIDNFSAKDWNALIELLESADEQKQTDEQDTLMTTISKWDSLSIDERFEALCAVGVREEKYLGIRNYTEIRITNDKIDDYTLAYYSDSDKLIEINVNQLDAETAEEGVNAIIHEVFHAYQYYVVDSLDFDSELVKDSYYYANAREWKYNIDNYILGYDNFNAYESQLLEADARAYATQRASIYLQSQG